MVDIRMVHWTRSGGNLCCLANRFSWKPQIINIQLSTIFFPNTLRNLRGRGGQWSEKFPRIGGGRDAPPSLPLLLQVLLKTLLSHNWPDATRCLTFDSNPNTFKIKYENFTKGEEIQKFQVAKWAKMGLWRREEKGRMVRNDLRDAKIGRGPPEKKSPGL